MKNAFLLTCFPLLLSITAPTAAPLGLPDHDAVM
jgi:hypothetical protein